MKFCFCFLVWIDDKMNKQTIIDINVRLLIKAYLLYLPHGTKKINNEIKRKNKSKNRGVQTKKRNSGFYKGRCPIHLKGAPQLFRPMLREPNNVLALEEIFGAKQSYDI